MNTAGRGSNKNTVVADLILLWPTETHYGLDGPGIESWWGRDFPHPSRSALVLSQPRVQRLLGLSRG
jgi:hypothetical protein